MTPKQFKTDWGGRELAVEVGRLAGQANGSVLVTYGQTVVLVTAVMSRHTLPIDYLPLSVNYEEKYYAAGKIKSGRFLKREGRATDEAVLTGRMIDRALRPCFDQRIRNDIQVVLTVLSFDKENDPDIPAMFGASLALAVSDIPWDGPISGVRIGSLLNKQDGEKNSWLLNPTYQAREQSDFDMVAAGKEERINMLEGDAKQIEEEKLLSVIEFAQSQIKANVNFQKEIIKEVGKKKKELELDQPDEELVERTKDWLGDKLENVLYQEKKAHRMEELGDIEKELVDELVGDEISEEAKEKRKQISQIFEKEIDKIAHKNILKAPLGKEKRPDGRKLDEVRKIETQIGFLPRTHGSGFFERGETQALSTVTLGAPGEGQTIESMEIDTEKNFMHHYNFPPFCTGEVGAIRGPGRREIGHGSLAERALSRLMPSKEDFPYTIRIVSEILSSNGSSSMASVSGSSLALMDAGVPIKDHVSGVAMGLMMESVDNYRVLTDIQGPEDHHGDMDCKIAGTKNGVTAIQMDVKIEGVTVDILKKVFAQAKQGRLYIIKEMEKKIDKPKKELSPLAPRILTIRINKDRIRDVIGPGGKIINEIIDQTGAKIDIEDDGLVNIASIDEEGGQKALEWVKNLTREVKVGEIFQGRVVKITDFGAFVEILPGQEGLVHISELAPYRVDKVEDVVRTGQIIPVKVKNIDDQGRIKLSLKDAKK